MVRCASWRQQKKDRSSFLIQSTSLCLFIGELRPQYSVIIKRHVLIPVILLILCFLDLFVFTVYFSPVMSWVCLSFSTVPCMLSSIFCRLGSLIIYSFSLLLLCKVFISPSILLDVFVGWNSLVGICDLSELGIYLSKPFRKLQKFPSNKLLFWWACFSISTCSSILLLLIPFLQSGFVAF